MFLNREVHPRYWRIERGNDTIYISVSSLRYIGLNSSGQLNSWSCTSQLLQQLILSANVLANTYKLCIIYKSRRQAARSFDDAIARS
jgi:hypothetical protein